jgi:hypothetical protein
MKDKKLRSIQMRNLMMGDITSFGSSITKLDTDTFDFDKLYNFEYKSKYAQHMYMSRIKFLTEQMDNKKITTYSDTTFTFTNYDDLKNVVNDIWKKKKFTEDFLDVIYDITFKVDFDKECKNNDYYYSIKIYAGIGFIKKVITFYKNNKEQIPEKEPQEFLYCDRFNSVK